MISLHGDLLSVVVSVPTTQSSSATIYIAVGDWYSNSVAQYSGGYCFHCSGCFHCFSW